MIQRFPLYYATFISAGAVMGLEIMGLGMLAPYFGTALVVQTNVIGVVLASLAIGYRLGGISADRGATLGRIQACFLFSALWVGFVFPFREIIGSSLGSVIPSVALGSLLVATILFAFPSIVLGMVLPHAIKMYVTDIVHSGKMSGVLYGISTLGSIFGVLIVAFFLLPEAQYEYSLFAVVVALLVAFVLLAKRLPFHILAVGIFSFALLTTLDLPDFIFHRHDTFSEGKIRSNLTEWKKLEDRTGIFSRLQVYEGTEETSGRSLRFLLVNGEVHSATYLDSNELVFNYALYNRLGGHFNPAAKKALLIGGGAYSYANYFLTDTPLYDIEKVWELDERLYHNNKTVSLPILFSNNLAKVKIERTLVYSSDHPRTAGEEEGLHNHLEAHNQIPTQTVTIARADILETGFDAASGYVHIHETKHDGTPGRIISPDVSLGDYLNRPRTIIGKGDLISGENTDVTVKLDRAPKEGEVLYAMLHRDNGNGHFDEFLVDGYEQIEALDVVEIDPRTTELAEKYFHLNKNDPRLRIFHEDGRTYINRSEDTYDIIYIDAFRSFYAVPWQLTTLEATKKLFDMMNENGVLVANVPASLTGDYSKFFQAELKTYQEVFPEVRVYASLSQHAEATPQNIIMVAFKNKEGIRETLNDDMEINNQLTHRWYGTFEAGTPLLTDDYAPTDYFTGKFSHIHNF